MPFWTAETMRSTQAEPDFSALLQGRGRLELILQLDELVVNLPQTPQRRTDAKVSGSVDDLALDDANLQF